jgi:hypothetical protein
MTVARAAEIFAKADALGLDVSQRHVFRSAQHDKAFAFYLALRSALADEFVSGRPFFLPAVDLANEGFLRGHHDRKLYMKLTHELMRLGVVMKIAPSQFTCDGKRIPARYIFAKRAGRSDECEVISLDARRQKRQAEHV